MVVENLAKLSFSALNWLLINQFINVLQ